MGTQTAGNTATPTGNQGNDSGAAQWATNASINIAQECYIDRIWWYCGGNSANCTLQFEIAGTGSNNTNGAGWTPGITYGVGIGWNSGVYPQSGYIHMTGSNSFYTTVYSNVALNIKVFNNGGGYWHRFGGPYQNVRTGFTENAFSGLSGDPGSYVEWFPPCSVSSVTSSPVAVGSNFTISGASFTAGISSIVINGSAGNVNVTSFTVNTDSQITATVPSGATSGTVTVNSYAGNATSSGTLTVSGGYVARAGAFGSSQGVFVGRSGSMNAAQGTYVARAGTWNPSQ